MSATRGAIRTWRCFTEKPNSRKCILRRIWPCLTCTIRDHAGSGLPECTRVSLEIFAANAIGQIRLAEQTARTKCLFETRERVADGRVQSAWSALCAGARNAAQECSRSSCLKHGKSRSRGGILGAVAWCESADLSA